MFANPKDKERVKSLYVASLEWFATFAAVMVTFLLTPVLAVATQPYIRAFTLNHYPPELVLPVEIGWSVILGGLIFFAARASLVVLAIGIGLIVFMRVFV